MGEIDDAGVAAPVAETLPSVAKAKRAHAPLWARMLLAANIVMFTAGWFHFLYGGGSGCQSPILKDGWSLDDTFVDLDDYVGHTMIELLPKAKVVRALIRSERITNPFEDSQYQRDLQRAQELDRMRRR